MQLLLSGLFVKVIFAGKARFRHAHIGDNLRLDGARFMRSSRNSAKSQDRIQADFNDVKVGASIMVPEAKFRGAADFGKAAADVLERRVKNSPPERNETKWLGGWKSRVKGY